MSHIHYNVIIGLYEGILISAASAPTIPLGLEDSDVDSDGDDTEKEVILLRTDDPAFNAFFTKSEQSENDTERVEVNVDDFDQIFMDSENM